MGQRSMLCGSHMVDIEMDQAGQGYLHPEPCIFLGGMSGFPQHDIQTVITAAGNSTNSHHHLPEHYDSNMFYGIPQYHGVQHHYNATNLDPSVDNTPNFYVPYMAPGNHGSADQLPSSNSYGIAGGVTDEYENNNHFLDNTRGSFKRKNTEGIPGNSQYLNTSAASSSSFTPANTRHPDEMAVTDCPSFPLPTYRGTGNPSMREVGLHRSVRNRLGANGVDPALANNHNNFIQGNFIGQPYPQSSPLWLDQQMSNNRSEGGPTAWSQAPAIPYLHGSSIGGSLEPRNISLPRYHETSSIRTTFLHPSLLRHHNFHYPALPPLQGVRGHNTSIYPQVAGPPYRIPTNYAPGSTVNPQQEGMEMIPRHVGPIQPTGFRIYRPHREGVAPGTAIRHHNLPSLRVMPSEGIAVIELPDFYDVGNYIDHHRDMRLDIEDMSYEELLALGDRIGSVNTGLSEENATHKLKTRVYLSSGINLEEAPPPIDQEPDSCIICQECYKNQDNIGTLECGHEYHADCLKTWLLVKNVCPVCKSEAVAT